MKRTLALLLILAALPVGTASAKPKLNVVLFLIDDLGWTDVGCYGSGYYETPNIDRLAQQGMKFTDAYATCCVCSPTRASILTGKYPGRLHITHAIPIQVAFRYKKPLPLLPAIYTKNLPLEEVTIAEALKDAGYVSASMGKWHVCWDKGFYPQDQGFDLNVGGNNMGNPGNYFHPYQGAWRMTPKHPLTRWNTLPDGKPGEYLTDRLTDEAITFIDKNRDRPFFLYLSHYAVHTPLHAKKKIIDKYKKKPATKHHRNATYAAMIDSVDQSVGRVMKRLDNLGIADRTVARRCQAGLRMSCAGHQYGLLSDHSCHGGPAAADGAARGRPEHCAPAETGRGPETQYAVLALPELHRSGASQSGNTVQRNSQGGLEADRVPRGQSRGVVQSARRPGREE